MKRSKRTRSLATERKPQPFTRRLPGGKVISERGYKRRFNRLHPRDKKTGRFIAKYEPVEVRSGYSGRDGNSYTLIVHMRRAPEQSDQDLSNLIEEMAGQGDFGTGYTWATFHNYFNVVRIKRAPKIPELVGFERVEP